MVLIFLKKMRYVGIMNLAKDRRSDNVQLSINKYEINAIGE
ncbi:MAG TPA: hypothetical protein VFT83_06075 [Nitrososphaeraceae archaeon]|jgi:hypothetical protein|nr:hypothetical protein [Nitrososphaeraceae archaeon]